jgi:Ras-related GTP-binding protein A/B
MFMENYIAQQRDHMFRNVEVLIYVFDVESREQDKDLQFYESSIQAIKANSKDAVWFAKEISIRVAFNQLINSASSA